MPACTRSASSGSANASAPPATVAPAPAVPAPTGTPRRGTPGAAHATRPAFVYVPTPAASGSVPAAAASEGAAMPSASAPTGPRITSISATPSVVHDGDTVHWDVRTTPDVVAVSARVATYGFDLQRSGPGHFTLGFAIPRGVPFFFHRTYTLDVVARDRGGESATSTISLSFQ